MKANIILIEPTTSTNGLVAHNDKHTHHMVNIVKKSINGRSGGLIVRFNLTTKEFVYDGSSWRNYRNYQGMTIPDFQKFIPKLMELQ